MNSFIALLIGATTASCSTFEKHGEQQGASASHEESNYNNTYDVYPSSTFVDGIPQINTDANLHSLCMSLNVSLFACSYNATPDLCKFEVHLNKVLEARNQSKYARSSTYTLVYTTVTLLASVFGVFGNAAVLMVACKERRDLRSCKLHIAELALVNFLFSLLQIINIVPLYWTNAWLLGLPLCKIIRTLLEIGTLMTIGFVLIIAVERYFVIVYPLGSSFTEGNFKHIAVAVDAILVMGTVIPYIIGLDYEENSGRCIQFEGKTRRLSLPYHWFVVVVYSIVPVCVITVLYTNIIRYLSRQASSKLSINKGDVHLKKMKTNRRIVYITLTILSCFLLCTLPTRVIFIYLETSDLGRANFYASNDMHVEFTLTLIGYFTYPFQCTINPVLYSMIDKDWRKELKSLFLFRRNKIFGRSSTVRNVLAHADRNGNMHINIEGDGDLQNGRTHNGNTRNGSIHNNGRIGNGNKHNGRTHDSARGIEIEDANKIFVVCHAVETGS